MKFNVKTLRARGDEDNLSNVSRTREANMRATSSQFRALARALGVAGEEEPVRA